MLAEVAHGFQARGWEVDVVTTCARDHYSWANEFAPGESSDGGVRVLRFPTDYKPNRVREQIGGLIYAGASVPIQDQYRWLNHGVRVPGLHEYLLDHGREYRAIVFAPYMFWTTVACAEIAPERTIVHPCLHDEPEARLEIFRSLFEDSRGLWFQTDPELELANRIFKLPSRIAMTGCAVDPPAGYDPDGFRRRHGIEGDFLLFAGRREWGKAWPQLLEFLEFANRMLAQPLPLVTMGVGEAGRTPANTKVHDLGWVDDQERSDAMAAATIYVQPSPLESFSRTIMEAWLAGTPVIANARSAVVDWHCRRSGAGLVYRDRYEFAECLRLLLEERDLARQMGTAGREYVLENYRRERVLDAMGQSLEEWT